MFLTDELKSLLYDIKIDFAKQRKEFSRLQYIMESYITKLQQERQGLEARLWSEGEARKVKKRKRV